MTDEERPERFAGCDLRVHDHPGLAAAHEDGDRVASLFVVDDRLLAGRWRSRTASGSCTGAGYGPGLGDSAVPAAAAG
jgi:hypothetical protein